MTRGNQREMDRAKAAKKQAALNKSKSKESNTTLAKRREADAEILRAKQKACQEERRDQEGHARHCERKMTPTSCSVTSPSSACTAPQIARVIVIYPYRFSTKSDSSGGWSFWREHLMLGVIKVLTLHHLVVYPYPSNTIVFHLLLPDRMDVD
ncbi:hypothetical protein EDD17DRAFT_223516 [Pisolithus thermaeus]|nr:hypothetical protein EDD17DRAFT_223516 [Pisolithus thermaeus]